MISTVNTVQERIISSTEPPEIIEVLRALQKRNNIAPRVPRRSDRVGFSLSTRDRYLFTLQTIQTIDTESGFDLIWNDGSTQSAVPSLAKNYKFRNAKLVEVNYGVLGGPDRAICFGLKRLLELGYDYLGLIENDILLSPGWFTRQMELFSLGAEDGIVCGSATARSFESHVLEYRSGYCLHSDTGAGMVLFSRPAAEIIVKLYENPVSLLMTTVSWRRFYADLFGVDLELFSPFWVFPPGRPADCTLDWGYTPSLYLNGYASLATMPSFAKDLEFDVETLFHTHYVGEDKNNSGVPYPRIARSEVAERSRPAPVPAIRQAVDRSVPVEPNPPLFANHRITSQEVDDAIQVASGKFPQRKIIVLHDGVDGSTHSHHAIDCRIGDLATFSNLNFSNSVFVYACSWHFHGSPYIRFVIDQGGRFIPVWNPGPASYLDQNAAARRVLEAEWITQRSEGFAKWDCGPGDFINLCQALEITRAKKGAFVEIGCYRGSSGSIALAYMKEAAIYRHSYFFDVFDGFTYDVATSSADAVWTGSHSTEGPARISERLKRHEQPELGLTVTVRRHNIIDEALPDGLPPIAIANIDVDLYEAVLAALTKVAPRITPGGVIVVEDPGHTPQLVGARIALDEFLSTGLASAFIPVYMESGQTFLIKKNKPSDNSHHS